MYLFMKLGKPYYPKDILNLSATASPLLKIGDSQFAKRYNQEFTELSARKSHYKNTEFGYLLIYIQFSTVLCLFIYNFSTLYWFPAGNQIRKFLCCYARLNKPDYCKTLGEYFENTKMHFS